MEKKNFLETVEKIENNHIEKCVKKEEKNCEVPTYLEAKNRRKKCGKTTITGQELRKIAINR